MKTTSRYLYFTNQRQWRQYLQELLARNDLAVEKAVVAIYRNQTDEERQCLESMERNKRGFDKRDCNYFSCLAMDILNGHTLTDKELAYSRYKMKRYWKQLMQISKQNIAIFLSENKKGKTIQESKESQPEQIYGASQAAIGEAKQLDFLDKLIGDR